MNTVKFRYKYNKVVHFEGYVNVPLDEFKDAKEIADYNPEYPEEGECESENDWSEMEYCYASCDMCAKELKGASEVNFLCDSQLCDDCFEEDDDDE